MTEYTTNPQAVREYMSAQQRTARWLQGVAGRSEGAACYSPSAPPSILEDALVPSAPPSDADSSHSSPPKMILRYGDGRPDVPIPHAARRPPHGQRTRSDAPAHARRYEAPPEEIRILPTAPSAAGHARSKSLSRAPERRRHDPPPPDVPFVPPHYARPPPAGFAPPPPQWPPRPHAKHPPAIVYAPPHGAQRAHYAPPALFHHTPQMGPNGMIYSHSAPAGPPGQFPPGYPTSAPYPSSHRLAASAHDVRTDPARRDRMRALGGRARRPSPSASSESLESRKSDSTYYVLPAHGQKVHVIAPSPDQSVAAASRAAHLAGTRKPFFQRFFNFKKFSHHTGSSSQGSAEGRTLRRRHSLTGGHPGSGGSSEDSP
ncbi:hypothetical protein HYPSUDRAFT_53893 [Hypholoma sublateritium FD-334 SS-4]|uniref:Uncharacterized protein n=1 Tax=Hypholoma sublateritium (strain FD-334 SS-4) TaxID=945553 RepID=A0A0D2MKP1_HYPSF|nr:hypothetical protein HYPSUDRAFT_53893 [Hypholoma sublateritium FD-334 SS-4]